MAAALGSRRLGTSDPNLFADDYDFGAGLTVVNWTEELKQILAAGGVR